MARESEIRQRAAELFRTNPTWGKRHVAAELRSEYRVAMSWESLLEIKKRVAYEQPERAGEFYRTGGVGLRELDIYNGWRQAGFTPFEARELTYGHGGVKVDARTVYNSETGKATRQTRKEWVEWLRSRGWSKRQIAQEARDYYKRGRKRSPWDFIRDSYRPRMKKDFNEYREMQRKRAEIKTNKLYKRGRR